MLISKGVAPGEVITLKLTSGEELVAKLVEETATHYRLSHPQVIGMGPQGPGLMPYLFTVDPKREISISKVTVTVAEPTDAVFAKQFIETTTTIKLV